VKTQGVYLASGLWDIECLPDDGGRIAALRFDGRDLLTAAPEPFVPPAEPPGRYETRPVYGYDDCFPSVDACTYPGRDRFEVPDHGELIWLPWRVCVEEGRLICQATCRLLPAVFRRTLRADGAALRWDYEIENASDEPLPCLHVPHALMPPQEITGLDLPDCRAVHDESREGIPPWSGGDDPAAYLLAGKPGTANMLLLRGCERGRAEVAFRDGPVVEIAWPVELFPTLGIWWNKGGFPAEKGLGRRECALEPMPGPASSLATSHHAGQCLHAPPRGRLAWSITWTVRHRVAPSSEA